VNLFSTRINRANAAPAHAQVRSQILGLIRDGMLRVGEKLPPEPQIAQSLGVSRMTANKAILALVIEGHLTREKGRGTFVAESSPVDLQRCVVAIPEDLSMALDNYYFGALYWAVHADLCARGVQVDVLQLKGGLTDHFHNPLDCGLIAINPVQDNLDDLLTFSRHGSPVVILGASWGDFGFNLVDSDNLLGPGLAVNHLANMGHEKIMFLGAALETSNTVDRVRGFQLAMKSRGLEVATSAICVVDQAEGFDEPTGKRLLEMFKSPGGPTGVFAAGPALAMQLLSLTQRHGISVPDQLSIVGYDDPNFLSLAHPAITTVRQPLGEMASVACEVLLSRLTTRDPRSTKQILDPQLIIRGTTSVPHYTLSEKK